MEIFLIIEFSLQTPVEGVRAWEVQLIRYRNYRSWIYYYNSYTYKSYGYCCDSYSWYSYYCSYYSGQCDNYFEFCIRYYGSTTATSSTSTCPYGRTVTPYAGDDSFSFADSYIGVYSSDRIDNPLIFTYTSSSGPVSRPCTKY